MWSLWDDLGVPGCSTQTPTSLHHGREAKVAVQTDAKRRMHEVQGTICSKARTTAARIAVLTQLASHLRVDRGPSGESGGCFVVPFTSEIVPGRLSAPCVPQIDSLPGHRWTIRKCAFPHEAQLKLTLRHLKEAWGSHLRIQQQHLQTS